MNRIIEALSRKVVFITGATGFLGQPLVEKILLSAPAVRRVYLLIRPRRRLGGKVLDAQERLRRELFQSSAFDRLYGTHGSAIETFLASKVIAVTGDISEENLGLGEREAYRLQQEVDVVINSAAVVSFDAPLDAALELNVISAGRTAAFARACRNAVLIHISTAYVSGNTTGPIPEVVHHAGHQTGNKEDPYPSRRFRDVNAEINHLKHIIGRVEREAHTTAVDRELAGELLKRFRGPRRGARNSGRRQKIETLRRQWIKNRLVSEGMSWARQRGWNDTYTFTKAMGEQAVLQARGDTPTAIIRPSVIESSLAEPSPGWLDGLRMADPLIVAIGKGRLRSLPLDADVTLDLIPVDMVVNAVLASIPRAAEKGGVEAYHVATGDKNPITLGELYKLIYGYFQRNPMLDKKGNPIRVRRLRFPKPSTFRFHHKLKTVPLEAAERTLEQLPLPNVSGRVKRKISAAKAAYERLYYYGEIYQPYLNLGSCFQVDKTLELFESLTEEEKLAFNFDMRQLNWRHYIQNIHIPGVKKHILKKEGVGTLEVAGGDGTEPSTIRELISGSAGRFPTKTALQVKRDGHWHRFTYEEVDKAAQGIAETLLRMGFRRGDRVVLFSENQPEWGVAFLGANFAGLVVVPLDAQTWHREVWATAHFTTSRALLVSGACLKKLTKQDLTANECSAEPIKLLSVEQLCAPHNIKEYPRSTQAPLQEKGATPPPPSPDDPVSVIFTTSTAVDPKGATHTQRSFMSNLLGVNHYLPVAESDQLLSVLPLYHALEFTCGFLMPLYGGATITYTHSLKPKVILGIMRETGSTCMLGVPTLYALIRDDIERRILRTTKSTLTSNLITRSKQLTRSVERAFGKNIGRSLFSRVHQEFGGRIRLFVSGGSALGAQLYEDFNTLGMPIYEGYGLTETAPVLTVNPLKRSKKGSAGKPLPGVELGIFNSDRNGVGEIIVKTPSLMSGYYGNPEATTRVVRHGWFHTGDAGWVDTDGYLYITGRIKDVIVTGAGKNVHPSDLEAIYREIPGILEICVLGVKSGLTEDVHALVVANKEILGGSGPDERKALQGEIQKLARDLPSYHRLQHIHVRSEPLTRSGSGEINREVARQEVSGYLQNHGPGASEGPGPHVKLEEKLLVELSRLSGLPPQEITPETHLYADLGLDSLMAIEVLLFVEHHFGVSIPDEVAPELDTVGTLLREVDSRAATAIMPPSQTRAALRSTLPYPQRPPGARLLQRLSFSVLTALYRTYFGLQLENTECLPRSKPFIVAANHTSHLDTGAIISALVAALGTREALALHVLGAKDYFFSSPWRGWFFSTFLNVVPVERQEASLAGLRMVRTILASGEPVLIFPEGTRSRTGRVQEFKPGLGLMALELNVPIVPAYIEGTHQSLPPGRALPRPGRVSIAFAPPIEMDRYRVDDDSADDEVYRRIAGDVREAIVALHGKNGSPQF